MNALDNVDRIKTPSEEVFVRDYVLTGTPVILTDLFDRHPIRALDTLEAFRSAFGQVGVTAQGQYVNGMINGVIDALEQVVQGKPVVPLPPPERREYSFAEYFDSVAQRPEADLIVNQNETPEEVLRAAPIPELARRRSDSDYAISNVWLANRGNVSSLHYDWDHTQVFYYQVFGRKRVIILRPEAAPLLNSLECFSAILPHQLSPPQRKAFLQYTDAYEVILQPGETLFFPPLVWHHIEYVDTSMSINYRCNRNRYLHYLWGDNFHCDMYMQGLAAKMVDEQAARNQYGFVFNEIRDADHRPYPSLMAKYKAMKALFRDLYHRVHGERVGGDHFMPLLDALSTILPGIYCMYERDPIAFQV